MTQKKVDTISVTTHEQTALQSATKQLIFWAYLVGAAGLSRWLFGGAWIVDIIIVVALLFWLVTWSKRVAGSAVIMTRSELREWVVAGMPPDVESWRNLRRRGLAADPGTCLHDWGTSSMTGARRCFNCGKVEDAGEADRRAPRPL